MAESEDGSYERIVELKLGMETKDLKISTEKMKVMCSGIQRQKRGKSPCSICKKNVGNSVILSTV